MKHAYFSTETASFCQYCPSDNTFNNKYLGLGMGDDLWREMMWERRQGDVRMQGIWEGSKGMWVWRDFGIGRGHGMGGFGR